MRLEVGGIGISISGGAGEEMLRRMPGFAVFGSDEGRADMRVELDAAADAANVEQLHNFDIVDGQMECRFGRLSDGRFVYQFGDEGVLTCPAVGSELEEPYRITTVHTPGVLRFALWSALSMRGLAMMRLPVHSSVVVCEGRAVMCLGESGTGKSTHTGLWLHYIEGTHLLNDDSPFLCLEKDGWYVYGSPWSGKTPCFRQERWPVAALVRIVQRPENTIERLGVLQAFGALQPSCPPCLMKDEGLQDRLVGYVGKAIESLPVYRLGCRPDEEAARLSHDTIF